MSAQPNTHQIHTAIREALAHERTAGKAEESYAQKMKAAGASMFAAFRMACAAAPELKGRKVDEKALERLYLSTTARPWWDEHLKAAKLVTGKGAADRDTAKRLIQWHLDPGAAQARHMTRKVQQLAAQKRLAGQRVAETRGMNKATKSGYYGCLPPGSVVQLDHHAARITEAATVAALGGRELPMLAAPDNAGAVTANDLLGECQRLISAARKVAAEDRATALEILRVTARELEELTS